MIYFKFNGGSTSIYVGSKLDHTKRGLIEFVVDEFKFIDRIRDKLKTEKEFT